MIGENFAVCTNVRAVARKIAGLVMNAVFVLYMTREF